ncbi:MAG: TonB-dependent receptor [Bacteroidales bacterium]|nr:TonB-dependent receptor [Bacteroidales bacterium]MBN2820967.1 TonB-dependent receptor [Bacteroidales bacterium]
MKRILTLFLLVTLSLAGVFGQGTNASVTGFVKDKNGESLIGATILIKNEATGFTSGTVAGTNGSYKFLQLPLGDNYSISCSFVGYGTQKLTGYALNQGDNLLIDFTLLEESESIEEVVVTANSLSSTIDKLGSSTSITAKDMATLPVNGRNFTSLMDLSPVSRGGNLLGQLYSSTNYTIDGMSNRSTVSSGTTNRGPYSISMEAIREFEVVTNDYDIVNGRSGGGIVSVVTKSGTNTMHGSAFLHDRADWLASPYDTRGNKRVSEFSIQQYGFTLGGPILKDRIHYFISYDGQRDARPLYIADIQSPEDEAAYNLSQSSLDRFMQISRGQYGVASSQQTGSFDKLRYSHAAFARIDWQLSPTHLLTIRNNFSRDMNNQGVSDNTSINIYEVYGSHLSTANSFMASLRSILGTNATNELKIQHLYTLDDGRPSDQLPAENIPRAIVQRVESTVNDKQVTTNIQIGGQRYLPETFEANVLQAVNNLYYTQGNINYTFGADVMLNHLNSLATSEFNGRFYFTGLDNYENLTPYRYAREVAVEDPQVTQNILAGGLYAQAQMMVGLGMDLTLGLRADYTKFLLAPNFNQVVFEDLGLKTDGSASGFQIQPRMQFIWDFNNNHTDVLKIGAGVFGSALNNYSDINNLQFDGTKIHAVDIQGDNVPTPDFVSYRNDPSTAPGEELFEIEGVSKVTTINMNSEDLKVPTVYKSNISYNRFFAERVRLGVNFIASFARNNYMYIDRNMVDDPYFRISNEANRGVFVPAETILTTNGSADWTQGRKTEEIGRVLELVSEGRNNTFTLVVDGTYRYFKDGQITASYTWNDSKDNTSYNGNVANSATLFQMVVDDPRDLSQMNYSNVQYRHKVVVYGTLPTFYGITFAARYSGLGGTRYSLRVNGNVNGDFVNSNDLAFVFDPANPSLDPAFAEAMQGVIDNPDNLAKDYIKESLGSIAKRNGGINGYYGTLDLRMSKRFFFNFGKTTGFELAADLFNVANLLNKEWGVSKTLSNQNLLTIKSFNPETNQYVYAVNTNVGVVNPGGTPYQFQISGKLFF